MKVGQTARMKELDAQRQYVVIGTLALLFVLCYCELFYVSRAAAPKGAMSVNHGDLIKGTLSFLGVPEACWEAAEECLKYPKA